MNDTVHLAYTDLVNGTYFVMYASRNSSGWSYQTIGRGQGVYGLVLDTNDTPHVLYGNPPGDGTNPLVIATWTGTNWIKQDMGIKNVGDAALALDSFGNPHIAYTEGGAMKYASWTGTNWQVEQVDTFSEGGGLSLALDPKDTPYILYSPSSYSDNSQAVPIRAINLRLTTMQNYSWTVYNVSLSSMGRFGNVVVDPEGYPHFVCTQHRYVSSEDKTIICKITYVSWDGATWKTQTVSSNVIEGSISSLVLDAKDNAHFIFLDQGGWMMYAVYSNGIWDVKAVGSSISSLASCNLALDSKGNPHVGIWVPTGWSYTAVYSYATANQTRSTSLPDATSPIVSALPLLAVLTAVLVAAGVVIVYVSKKKLKNQV